MTPTQPEPAVPEGRLLHARKLLDDTNTPSHWQVINPELGGIPVLAPLAKSDPHALVRLIPGPLIFLLGLVSKGGAWEGWSLYAIGPLNQTSEAAGETVVTMEHFNFILIPSMKAENPTGVAGAPKNDGEECKGIDADAGVPVRRGGGVVGEWIRV